MKDIKHSIPELYLEEISNSQTKRHARIVAGWLNWSYGNTRENRRANQIAITARKRSKQVIDNNRGNNKNHI